MTGVTEANAVDLMAANDATPNRGYVLTLLASAYLLNYFDRSIVNVLLDTIKADLRLSDTAIGFIAGLGFALLYTILGIPLARLADRHGRKSMVVVGLGLWSVMTAMGGAATSGLQLAIARTGVGIGEAAGTAPSVAMIAEFFSKNERPRALSLLNIGMPLGILAGIMFGGIANQWVGWRVALLVAGVPGLVVAALLQFTVPERKSGPADLAGKGPGVKSALRLLAARRSYMRCIAGSFFSGFALNALFVWTPSLFRRVYHLAPSQIGMSVGLSLGLCGALGCYAGGIFVSRVGSRDDRWKAGQPALACLLALPFLITMLLVHDTRVALACLCAGSFLLLSLLGPLYSVYQSVVPPSTRAFATAIHNFLGTIGGLGLGSLLVGMASDHLSARYGDETLRYALLLPMALLIPAGLLYASATITIRSEIVDE